MNENPTSSSGQMKQDRCSVWNPWRLREVIGNLCCDSIASITLDFKWPWNWLWKPQKTESQIALEWLVRFLQTFFLVLLALMIDTCGRYMEQTFKIIQSKIQHHQFCSPDIWKSNCYNYVFDDAEVNATSTDFAKWTVVTRYKYGGANCIRTY